MAGCRLAGWAKLNMDDASKGNLGLATIGGAS